MVTKHEQRLILFQETGLCISCRQTKPETQSNRCNGCINKHKEQMKVRRTNLLSNDICPDCMGILNNNKKRCDKCLVKIKFKNFLLRKKAIEKIYLQKNNSNYPVCRKCGQNDIRILTINHINHNGPEDKKIHSNSFQFYRAILNGKREINDLEILCYNCNILYEYEAGNYMDFTNYQRC